MKPIMLYRTREGAVACREGQCWPLDADWDELLNDDALPARLDAHCGGRAPNADLVEANLDLEAPLVSQELWGCGVTYRRSREARVAESADAGGGDFYQRVYDAERPEVFFKATPHRIVGPGGHLHLRSDSDWIVPEPELALVVTRRGVVVGCTVGNDLSCRDIEGENPLYLPQAKTFDRCAAVGPGVLVSEALPRPDTRIRLAIRRAGDVVFYGETRLSEMKRSFEELVQYAFRDNAHPAGCVLLTGTGIVPNDDVALADGDVVEISIDGIGTLSNPVRT